MRYIYLITDNEDGMPIGAADTLDDALLLADDYYGSTEEYSFSRRRTDVKIYEYKYGGETLYGIITYEGKKEIQKANIWEIDYYPKTII